MQNSCGDINSENWYKEGVSKIIAETLSGTVYDVDGSFAIAAMFARATDGNRDFWIHRLVKQEWQYADLVVVAHVLRLDAEDLWTAHGCMLRSHIKESMESLHLDSIIRPKLLWDWSDGKVGVDDKQIDQALEVYYKRNPQIEGEYEYRVDILDPMKTHVTGQVEHPCVSDKFLSGLHLCVKPGHRVNQIIFHTDDLNVLVAYERYFREYGIEKLSFILGEVIPPEPYVAKDKAYGATEY